MTRSNGHKAGAASAAILVLGGLLLASAAPAAPAAPPDPIRIMEGSGAQITSFFFGKSNQITPVPPVNESAGQTADALGVTFPRALVSIVGTWSVTLVEEAMFLDSLDGLSIWASSSSSAENVRFIIQVEVNGNTAGTLYTERKATVSPSPEEFRIDPGSSTMSRLDFPKGSQLTFQLQYQASSSPLPVGPSAGSTFHYYGDLYRSRVDFVTTPFNLTLSEMKVDEVTGVVNVTEIVKDAFGVDPKQKVFSLTFNGPTNSRADHVRLVSTFPDPLNGTTLFWNWEFAMQRGVSSGDYVITLTAQYAGSDVNYSNVSTAPLKFPRMQEAGGGFTLGSTPFVLVGVAAVAAVAVALRAAAVRRARRL